MTAGPAGQPPMAAVVLSKRRAWWLALRPFSYPASIVPVLVGTALAAGQEFSPGLFLLALAGAVLIHAGTNLATDFFDFVDGVQPPVSLGAAIRSGLKPDAVHRAAVLAFVLGSACGLVIVAYTGWPILLAGVASVAAGYFYSAGPIMYGRRGLGEAMVFIFMGPLMVMASYYVQTQDLTWASLYASLPVGILVANILHANNLRDIDNDRRAGKLTIASATGRPASDYTLWGLVVSAFVVVLVGAAAGWLSAWTLLVALAAPAAVTTLRALEEYEAVRLNVLVRGAAMLHLQFGVLMALGLLIGALT